jgi:hypothetical protein
VDADVVAAGEDNASNVASKTCETANRLALVDRLNPIDRAVTNILDQGDEESCIMARPDGHFKSSIARVVLVKIGYSDVAH